MLLKQSKPSNNIRFTKGTSQQREAQMLRMEAVKGIYVPKERRLAKKQEINRAHFSLGNDQQMPKKSYGQDLID